MLGTEPRNPEGGSHYITITGGAVAVVVWTDGEILHNSLGLMFQASTTPRVSFQFPNKPKKVNLNLKDPDQGGVRNQGQVA